MELTDGAFGDGDGVANGVIVDPSGLGYSPVSAVGGQPEEAVANLEELLSSCFISGAAQHGGSADPVNIRFGWMLVGLLLAAIARRKMRSPGAPMKN